MFKNIHVIYIVKYRCTLSIEILDIECVLGHESCREFFHTCPYKSAILNLTRSENYKHKQSYEYVFSVGKFCPVV